MLAELRITDIAIIDALHLEFGEGLHVLSGETGAGKSIILDALGLVLGGRADPGLVREGKDEAVVEASFRIEDEPWMVSALEAVGLEADSELVVRRVISRQGRNRIHVNGSPLSASALRRLSQGLVDFSSQHEQQYLLDPARHLDILDAFAGHSGRVEEMGAASAALREATDALATLRERAADRAEREAFIRFQLEELDRVAPRVGEDEELEIERRRLAHSEKLHANSQAVERALYSGGGAVVEVLGDVMRRLTTMAAIDPELKAPISTLESALYQVEDVARAMGAYAREVEFNPERLEEISARLDALAALKRKYRAELGPLLARRDEMRAELATLENFEHELGLLERRRKAAEDVAANHARELTVERGRVASELQTRVEAELQSLHMPGARFKVVVSTAEDAREIGPRGWDRVEFHLSANPGEPPRPLSKVASGGELSRILLALKVALSGAGDVGTFIFDEVDTGIGGAAAEVVGRKMRQIARHRQVISITHLAQIAAYGHRHFNVVKEITGGRTSTRVEVLDPQRRVEEIARMLGGLHITTKTREHARELIERCQVGDPQEVE